MISNVSMMGLVSNVSAVVASEAVIGITEDTIPSGVKLVRSAPVISVEGRKPVVGETEKNDGNTAVQRILECHICRIKQTACAASCCNPILVTTFPKWLSGMEPWTRTPGAMRPSSLCL